MVLTHTLRQIRYHYNKINRGNDILIDLMGADHHGYINRLKASLETFGVDSIVLKFKSCKWFV